MMEIFEYRIHRTLLRTAPPLKVTDQTTAASFVRDQRVHHDREQFFILHLDVRLHVLGYELIAIGSDSAVEVAPREIFRGALLNGAHAIVLAHNHPSNDPTPSAEDDVMTRRMFDAGKLLGIPVLDHIIITDHDHYSYAEQDRLERFIGDPHPSTEPA